MPTRIYIHLIPRQVGNVHGMPLGASLGEGYESDAINEPNAEVVDRLACLTHMGKKPDSPKGGSKRFSPYRHKRLGRRGME